MKSSISIIISTSRIHQLIHYPSPSTPIIVIRKYIDRNARLEREVSCTATHVSQ